MKTTRPHLRRAALLALLILALLLSACAGAAPGEESAAPSPPPVEEAPLDPGPPPPPMAEAAAGLEITELMPANRCCLPGENGLFPDWIELCNCGEQEVSLEGLFLSDSERDLQRFALPGGSLAPGQRLLVFCGGDGAPFSLKREGETLYLSAADGSLVQTLTYGETEPDCSVCFRGGEAYRLPYATPGYPNTEEGLEAFLRERDGHGAVVISEIVSCNTDFSNASNQRGQYYDWIELQNVSDAPVDLGDYWLSDDPAEPWKSRLSTLVLSPGARVLIYCSGDSGLGSTGFCHVDFALHSGESVWLRSIDGRLSDCVTLPRVPLEGSYGRLPGEAGFFYLPERSPGLPNGEGFRLMSPQPEPSLPQGIYQDVQDLVLSLAGEGEIRYTLDGSLPNRETGLLYTDPIPLEATAVIRAVHYEEGRLPSPCLTLSYIVNEGHSLPVLSLVCDQAELNYLNQSPGDGELEIRADTVLFERPGEEPLFASGCGMKLHGASSRKFDKKSYKLIFRGRYGGDLRCDLFRRGGEHRYHALLLRGRTVEHMYIVKDSLAALTAIELMDEPLALDSRYCILYINGAYYGIYDLREAYCERYVLEHTGSEEGRVDIERNRGKLVGAEIYHYLRDHSVAGDEAYAAFCQGFDAEAFASWMALEAYFNNKDPEGNIRFIRGSGTGGKWKPALFDLDLCLYTENADFFLLKENAGGVSLMVNSLLQNPGFRETLLRRSAELYHAGLGAECTRRIFAQLCRELEPEVQRNCQRWQEGQWLWEEGRRDLYNRLGNQRTLSWIQSLQALTRASDEEIAFWFGDLSPLYTD